MMYPHNRWIDNALPPTPTENDCIGPMRVQDHPYQLQSALAIDMSLQVG